MKTRIFLSSTAVLAATLLAGSAPATEQHLQTAQVVNVAGAAIQADLATSVPELTVKPVDTRLAQDAPSHGSHSSHSSHASHSSHTSSSFV